MSPDYEINFYVVTKRENGFDFVSAPLKTVEEAETFMQNCVLTNEHYSVIYEVVGEDHPMKTVEEEV